MLWAAVTAWLGSLAGTEAALAAWRVGEWWPIAAAGGAALLVAAAMLRVRGAAAARIPAIVGAVAVAVALARGVVVPAECARLEAAGVRPWAGTAVSEALTGPFGTSLRVGLDAAPVVTALVTWPSGEPTPSYGQRVTVWSRLRVPLRPLPASAEAFRQGAMLRASPWRVAVGTWAPGLLGPIARWRAATLDRLDGSGVPGARMLASMLFGVAASGEAASALENAKLAGVAWAMSASGLHLAAVVLLVERLASLAGLGRRGRAWAVVGALAALALACALKLSLLRAAFAAGAGVVARGVGRRRDPTAALGAVVLGLMLFDPGAAYDIGLLIGSLAVAGISLLGPLVSAWLAPLVGRRAGRALGASVAAQMAVAPLVAALFGGVAALGPLALLASAPLVGAAVSLGLLGAVVPALPPAANVLLGCGSVLAQAASAVWAGAAALPSAYIAVPAVGWWVGVAWVAVACALWIRWPLPRRRARVRAAAGAVAAALALSWALTPPAITSGIVVMDVGQGDAILVRDAGHTVLVDTGPEPAVLRRALARQGIGALDGVVLTHAHLDHIGGLDGLAGIARPGWIGVPDVTDDGVDALARRCASRAGRVVRLRRDMTFTVGSLRVRVLWPWGGERGLSANDTSVILLVESRGQRALLLGDAEERAQRGALQVWAQPVAMLKVAHHGSPNGNVPEALASWKPPLALISVGAGNSFGHPSQTALHSLASIGAQVRRTDKEGDLSWTFDVAAAIAASALCDNRMRVRPSGELRAPTLWTLRWPPPTFPISSRSTSSTAPRSCCWSAPRSACVTVLPPWPISTSTWRRSTGRPPPWPTSSTQPTRCLL